MARPRLDRPTDAELQILDVLWSRRGATVRDVFNVLGPIRGSGYNSVLKLIQIMHDKKYVRRDDSVRPQIYHAVIGEVQTKRLLLKDLLHRVFGDDAAAMIGHILALRKATPSQLAQIRKELDGAGRGKGK